MATPGSISVLLPILNGEAFLERVLESLAAQRVCIPWDFLALDCGSTDRTLEIFADFASRFPVPLRVHGTHTSEFNHGDSRNTLAALSDGELLVFIVDDSIPVGEEWLATILENFEDPEVSACYARNEPRPEADVLAKSLSAGDPGYRIGRRVERMPELEAFELMDGDAIRALFNYNDTASVVRRRVWERHPYPRCDFGEDVLFARAILESGGVIVYEDRVTIYHSHEYDAPTTRARAKEDALFNIEWLNRRCVRGPAALEQAVALQTTRDQEALEEAGIVGEEYDRRLAEAIELRRALYEGLYEGSESPRRFSMSAALDDTRPRVAHVAGAAASCLEGADEALARLEERGWTCLRAGADEALELFRADRADVLHVHGFGDDVRGLVESAWRQRIPTLVTVDLSTAEQHGLKKAVLSAHELDANPKCTVPLIEGLGGNDATDDPLEVWIWRSAEELDDSRGAGRGIAVGLPEERARVLEVRYRGLSCRARRSRYHGGYCFDRSAREGQARGRKVGFHGRDMVLLGPKRSSLTFELEGVGAGRHELSVWLYFTDAESDLEQSGRILIDGQLLTRFGSIRQPREEGGIHLLKLEIDVPRPGARLKIVNTRSFLGRPGFVRVQRVRLRELESIH